MSLTEAVNSWRKMLRESIEEGSLAKDPEAIKERVDEITGNHTKVISRGGNFKKHLQQFDGIVAASIVEKELLDQLPKD